MFFSDFETIGNKEFPINLLFKGIFQLDPFPYTTGRFQTGAVFKSTEVLYQQEGQWNILSNIPSTLCFQSSSNRILQL